MSVTEQDVHTYSSEKGDVIEMDIHTHTPSTKGGMCVCSAVQIRLQQQTAASSSSSPRTPAEAQRQLDTDMASHFEKREKILERRVAKLKEREERVRRRVKQHDQVVMDSILALKDTLQEKQKWAEEVRSQCRTWKMERGRREIEKANKISAEKRAATAVCGLELSQWLERSQLIAAQNREAFLEFKRVTAQCDVEHAERTHDLTLLKKEKARLELERAIEQQQLAASRAHELILKMKSAHAHLDLVHAIQVRDDVRAREEEAVCGARYRYYRRQSNATALRLQRWNEIRLRGHDDVVHALEVAMERREGMGDDDDSDDDVDVDGAVGGGSGDVHQDGNDNAVGVGHNGHAHGNTDDHIGEGVGHAHGHDDDHLLHAHAHGHDDGACHVHGHDDDEKELLALEQHLLSLNVSVEEQRHAIDAWWHAHVNEMGVEGVVGECESGLPDELNPKLRD